jgi:hypothetical protein
MKKITIYIILLMLYGFTSFGQANQTRSIDKNSQAAGLADPKLSPEQQAQRLKAGEDNPAKIDPSAMVDPKIDPKTLPTEKDFGVANAKPDAKSMTDPRLKPGEVYAPKQDSKPLEIRSDNNGNQPAGDRSGTIIDYRSLPAGPANQPAGATPQHMDDYLNVRGTASQPGIDVPNR